VTAGRPTSSVAAVPTAGPSSAAATDVEHALGALALAVELACETAGQAGSAVAGSWTGEAAEGFAAVLAGALAQARRCGYAARELEAGYSALVSDLVDAEVVAYRQHTLEIAADSEELESHVDGPLAVWSEGVAKVADSAATLQGLRVSARVQAAQRRASLAVDAAVAELGEQQPLGAFALPRLSAALTAEVAAGALLGDPLGDEMEIARVEGAALQVIAPGAGWGALDAADRAFLLRLHVVLPRGLDLDGHEGPRLGHTIERHVGKSDAYLLARLTNPKIPLASTWATLPDAEAALTVVVRDHLRELEKLAPQSRGKKLDETSPLPRRIAVYGYAASRRPIPRSALTLINARPRPAPSGRGPGRPIARSAFTLIRLVVLVAPDRSLYVLTLFPDLSAPARRAR